MLALDCVRVYFQEKHNSSRRVFVTTESVLTGLLPGLETAQREDGQFIASPFLRVPISALSVEQETVPTHSGNLLAVFLELIRGQLRSVNTLQGCVFSTSGFPRRRSLDDDKTVPTRCELAAAISLTGARLGQGAMVQGVTTHLVCLHRRGDKYEAASRWGADAIHIVEWPWLLQVLLHGVPGIAVVQEGAEGAPVPSQFDFYAPTQHSQEQQLSSSSPRSSSSSSSLHSRSPSRKRAKQERQVQHLQDGPRRFAFGGGRHDDSIMTIAKSQLEALGAEVVWPAAPRFDDDGACMHLVVFGEQLKRTEKYLCAVAAGRWVLTPDYVRSSHAAGRLLPCESYEAFAAQCNRNDALAAAAAFRRTQRATGQPLLFAGQRFLIVGTTMPPADVLVAIVQSGGGTAVTATAAASDLGCTYTAIVAETLGAVDTRHLVRCLDVVTPLYILDSVCAPAKVHVSMYMAK